MIPDLAFPGSKGRVRDAFVKEQRVDQSRFGMRRVHRHGQRGAWTIGTSSLLMSNDSLEVLD